MTNSPTVLPQPFQDLEAHLDWALATESERAAKRVSSPMQDIQTFYDTMLPRLDSCAAYLDQFPLHQLPPDAERLLWMTLSLMEVANAVELYKQPRLSNGFDIARFVPSEKNAEIAGWKEAAVQYNLSPCDLELAIDTSQHVTTIADKERLLGFETGLVDDEA